LQTANPASSCVKMSTPLLSPLGRCCEMECCEGSWPPRCPPPSSVCRCPACCHSLRMKRERSNAPFVQVDVSVLSTDCQSRR
jgi:hypothetical protein